MINPAKKIRYRFLYTSVRPIVPILLYMSANAHLYKEWLPLELINFIVPSRHFLYTFNNFFVVRHPATDMIFDHTTSQLNNLCLCIVWVHRITIAAAAALLNFLLLFFQKSFWFTQLIPSQIRNTHIVLQSTTIWFIYKQRIFIRTRFKLNTFGYNTKRKQTFLY